MNTPIIWNYEDIDSNLLAVECDGQSIGYFKIDKDDFVIVNDQSLDYPSIPLKVLIQIVNGYDEALEVVQKIKNEGEKHG